MRISKKMKFSLYALALFASVDASVAHAGIITNVFPVTQHEHRDSRPPSTLQLPFNQPSLAGGPNQTLWIGYEQVNKVPPTVSQKFLIQLVGRNGFAVGEPKQVIARTDSLSSIVVSSILANFQIQSNSAGELLATWDDRSNATSPLSIPQPKIMAQRFDANGVALGSAFPVYSGTGVILNSVAHISEDGSVVFAYWIRDTKNIVANRYSATGTRLGSTVNIKTTINNTESSLIYLLAAGAADGSYFIADTEAFTLSSAGLSINSSKVYLQKIAADGTLRGARTLTASASMVLLLSMGGAGSQVFGQNLQLKSDGSVNLFTMSRQLFGKPVLKVSNYTSSAAGLWLKRALVLNVTSEYCNKPSFSTTELNAGGFLSVGLGGICTVSANGFSSKLVDKVTALGIAPLVQANGIVSVLNEVEFNRQFDNKYVFDSDNNLSLFRYVNP